MNYTEEEKEHVETILNQCIKIKHRYHIYYITSKNIIRQLKYNQLFKNENKIKFNLNEVNFIFLQDTLNYNFYISYKWSKNNNFNKTFKNILYNILNLKNYHLITSFLNEKYLINVLNNTEYDIY